MSKFTVENCTCPFFGRPKDLYQTTLPSYKDVILCCLEERRLMGRNGKSNKEPRFSVIAETVAMKVIDRYKSACIPHVTFTRVVQLITALHKKYRKVKLYHIKLKINASEALRNHIETFKLKGQNLFDIASCKCKSFIDCECPVDKRVPLKAQVFLLDQRCARKRFKRTKIEVVEISPEISPLSSQQLSENASSQNSESLSNSEDFVVPSNLCEEKLSTQCRLNLDRTVLVAQRYGVSERATAAIASSVLADVGLVSDGKRNLVTDKNKVRRSKIKLSSSLETEFRNNLVAPQSLYFDGRKDDTILQVKMGSKFRRSTVKEEHISVLSEPGTEYLGHFVPMSGSAEDICNGLYELMLKKGGINNLESVGCDGTVVNTGWKNGIIRCLEKKIGRPLQWIICLLHFNELPFRALFTAIDGVTDGPNSFSGSIGKALKDCEKKSVIKFKKIPFILPEVDKKDLSQDQKYLYNISAAIGSGECPFNLSIDQPGPLNHARWVTCANRVLRLYVSTSKPTPALKTLVIYLLKVYVPQWFRIRRDKSLKNGSRHFFNAIQLSRYLPKKHRIIVDKTIARNAFFALPENILLSMISDQRAEVRKEALNKILHARLGNTEHPQVQSCKLPEINFNAAEYFELIDWSETSYVSPPVLQKVSNEELIRRLSLDNVYSDWEFYGLPCHTVGVERLVKLVTEASSKMCGPDSRDSWIRATLESRRRMPQYNSKKEFVV